MARWLGLFCNRLFGRLCAENLFARVNKIRYSNTQSKEYKSAKCERWTKRECNAMPKSSIARRRKDRVRASFQPFFFVFFWLNFILMPISMTFHANVLSDDCSQGHTRRNTQRKTTESVVCFSFVSVSCFECMLVGCFFFFAGKNADIAVTARC